MKLNFFKPVSFSVHCVKTAHVVCSAAAASNERQCWFVSLKQFQKVMLMPQGLLRHHCLLRTKTASAGSGKSECDRGLQVLGAGQDSAVCIATGYGLDGSGVESRLGQDFPNPPDWPWGSPCLPYSEYGVTAGRRVAVTTPI
jgi:hypothetical protein